VAVSPAQHPAPLSFCCSESGSERCPGPRPSRAGIWSQRWALLGALPPPELPHRFQGENPAPTSVIPRALTPRCRWQRGCHGCRPRPPSRPGSPARVTRRWMVPVIVPVLPRGGVTVIYGTICGGPRCEPGAGGHAVPRGMSPARGPRRAPFVPGVGSGGTGAVPLGAAGTVGAASSSHGVLWSRSHWGG